MTWIFPYWLCLFTYWTESTWSRVPQTMVKLFSWYSARWPTAIACRRTWWHTAEPHHGVIVEDRDQAHPCWKQMPLALLWNLLSSSDISARCKCAPNYILTKYIQRQGGGWCLDSSGSGRPPWEGCVSLGLSFPSLCPGMGWDIFWWSHTVGHDPDSPFDSAGLSVVEPTTVPVPCPPSWVPSIYLLKHLGICNHVVIKTNVRFKTSSENDHKAVC